MSNSARTAIPRLLGAEEGLRFLRKKCLSLYSFLVPLAFSSESIRIDLSIFKMITDALKIQTLKTDIGGKVT